MFIIWVPQNKTALKKIPPQAFNPDALFANR